VAVFRLGGWTVTLPLETHQPFATARGRLSADLFGGEYAVSVRLPNGSEIAVGAFTVFAPPPPPPVTSLYVLASPEESIGGPHRIAAGSIGADGTVTFPATLLTTGGLSARNHSDTGLAVSPDGSFLFVGHNSSNQVEAFARQPDGSLVSTSIVSGVTTASSIVAHPTLPLIYVADLDRELGSYIRVFGYSGSGVLSLVQTVATAPELRGIALAGGGSFLVTTHMGFSFGDPPFSRVDVYGVDADGHLEEAPVDSDTPADAGRFDDVVVDPASGNIFVKDLDRGIYGFGLSSMGALMPLNGGLPYLADGSFVFDVKIANGALFVLFRPAESNGSVVTTFAVQPAGLIQANSLNVGGESQKLAVTEDGTMLFTSDRGVPSVRSFTVDAGLALTEVATSPLIVLLNPGEVLGRLIVMK
jgi:hypothetical protein